MGFTVPTMYATSLFLQAYQEQRGHADAERFEQGAALLPVAEDPHPPEAASGGLLQRGGVGTHRGTQCPGTNGHKPKGPRIRLEGT